MIMIHIVVPFIFVHVRHTMLPQLMHLGYNGFAEYSLELTMF